MNEHTARVRAAIAATDPCYWEKVLSQRAGLGELAAGSTYPDLQPKELEKLIRAADWQPFTHPDLSPDCVAFSASVWGRLGIVPLSELEPQMVVTYDDRKNVKKVSVVISGKHGAAVPHTVMILGPADEDAAREVVWTFHPGDPIKFSQVDAEGRVGMKVTVAEAMALGLTHAKIV